MNRRHVLLSAGALATIVALPALAASPPTELQVFKSPTCGCCGAWVEHMRAAGFSVKVTEVDEWVRSGGADETAKPPKKGAR